MLKDMRRAAEKAMGSFCGPEADISLPTIPDQTVENDPRSDIRGAEQLFSILVRKAPISMPLIVPTLSAEFID
ncbi:MAG: hypothetical protein E5W93_05185 [Mesorhizobium sp.]|nr:MAG: hypothetical protein E5W93_05185 [Mesorhizobium sp.]